MIALPPQPEWTQEVILLEFGREFSAVVGQTEPEDYEVRIFQSEHVDWDAEPATVRRDPPQLRIDGRRLSLDAARSLATLITHAHDLLTADRG